MFPPSAWFFVSNPLPFAGVFAAVLLASAWAARMHGVLCAALLALLLRAKTSCKTGPSERTCQSGSIWGRTLVGGFMVLKHL